MVNHPQRSRTNAWTQPMARRHYFPTATAVGAILNAHDADRAAEGAGKLLSDGKIGLANVRVDGHHTDSGVDALFGLDRKQIEAQRQRNIAAFVRGREALAAAGFRLCGEETSWRGRDVIEVVQQDGRITTISERDCYVASRYGDEAGCLYYYLHCLLRPTEAMDANDLGH